MKVRDDGWTEEALDFDGNPSIPLLGTKQLFGTEVDVHVNAAELDKQWVVGDGPPIFDKGVFHGGVKDIVCWHFRVLLRRRILALEV
jgi:hypothetical protein